ncbi:unnamed protein product [Ectocarpus sp. 13 AM-2016]
MWLGGLVLFAICGAVLCKCVRLLSVSFSIVFASRSLLLLGGERELRIHDVAIFAGVREGEGERAGTEGPRRVCEEVRLCDYLPVLLQGRLIGLWCCIRGECCYCWKGRGDCTCGAMHHPPRVGLPAAETPVQNKREHKLLRICVSEVGACSLVVVVVALLVRSIGQLIDVDGSMLSVFVAPVSCLSTLGHCDTRLSCTERVHAGKGQPCYLAGRWEVCIGESASAERVKHYQWVCHFLPLVPFFRFSCVRNVETVNAVG